MGRSPRPAAGLTFTAPASYEALGRCAFTSLAYDGSSAVIVLPDDYFSYYHETGMGNYIKQIITHEIGHAAFEIKHPHEIPALLELVKNADNPEFCSIMDPVGAVSNMTGAAAGVAFSEMLLKKLGLPKFGKDDQDCIENVTVDSNSHQSTLRKRNKEEGISRC